MSRGLGNKMKRNELETSKCSSKCSSKMGFGGWVRIWRIYLMMFAQKNFK